MQYRLGDIVDDHCTRCAMLTNHSIVAVMGAEIARVRCRTCNHEHPYRSGEGGRKRPAGKGSAFEQVLAGILGEQPQPASAAPARKRTASRRGRK
jgi:hypothetical protein